MSNRTQIFKKVIWHGLYPDDHPYLLHTKIDEFKTQTDSAFNQTESDFNRINARLESNFNITESDFKAINVRLESNFNVTEVNFADLKDSFDNLTSDCGNQKNASDDFFNLTKKIDSLDQN